MKNSPFVYLCGAGPGAVDLLTVRAYRLLTSGMIDCVLYDRLGGNSVLDILPKGTEAIFVGKRCGHSGMTQEEINERLVAEANSGKITLRLKGGDPLLFGRAGEEMCALRHAGIPFEVVPGVTAAAAAAAAARVPLTQRRIASSIRFVTGHGKEGEIPDFTPLAGGDATLAVYMGLGGAERICRQLMEGGLSEQTACVAVERASLPNERIVRSSLKHFAADVKTANLASPALLLIGPCTEEEARTTL